MSQSYFLFSVAPFYRAVVFLPLLMGILGLAIYVQMATNYVAGAPFEFIVWAIIAILMLCVRCHFTPTNIKLTLFGVRLKDWAGSRFTSRPEKKLHRVFDKDEGTGHLRRIPLLLSRVPFCLYEFKDAQ